MPEDPTLRDLIERIAAQQAEIRDQMFQRTMDLDEMQLPIDEGLHVVFQSVPGDAFDESHLHMVPQDDVIVMHLTPEDAQIFDDILRRFSDKRELECKNL